MRKNMFKKVMSFLLVTIITAFILVGCKGKDKENQKESKYEVSNVPFSLEGSYEVKVSGEDVKKIQKNALKITYRDIDNVNNSYKVVLKEAKIDTCITSAKEAKVRFVAPSNYPIGAFKLAVNGASEKVFNVLYPEYELKVDKVLDTLSDSHKVVLTMVGGNLIDGVKPEMIHFGGLYENLKVETISNNKNTITMQLSGKVLEPNTLEGKLAGSIILSKQAIVDGLGSAKCEVEVLKDNFEFAPETLEMVDGYYKVDLLTANLAKPLEITDITFSDKVVLKDIKSNLERSHLRLEIKDAKTLDEAAKVLDKEVALINGHQVHLSFKAASFYPVFDYLEQNENNFNLTIKLLAENGKFNNLEAKDITLGEELKDAKVLEVKVDDSKLVAEVKLEVPSLNEETEDSFKRNGKIELESKALVNLWKTDSSKTSYERDFSQETLGKDDTTQVEEFRSKVGAFNNPHLTFAIEDGKNSMDLSGGLVQTFLILLGITETPAMATQRMMRQFHQTMTQELNEQTHTLEQIAVNVSASRFNSFNTELNNLNTYVRRYVGMMNDLARAKGIEIPKENASQAQYDSYIEALKTNGLTEMPGYRDLVYQLDIYYTTVTNQVAGSMGVTNPFVLYEDFCSHIFNFSSGALESKLNFTALVNNVIYQAYSVLGIHNLVIDEATGFGEIKKAFVNASSVAKQEFEALDKSMKAYKKMDDDHDIYFYTYKESIKNRLSSYVGSYMAPIVTEHPYKDRRTGEDRLFYQGNNKMIDPQKALAFEIRMGSRTLEEELKISLIDYRDRSEKDHSVIKDANGLDIYSDFFILGYPNPNNISEKAFMKNDGMKFELRTDWVNPLMFGNFDSKPINVRAFISAIEYDIYY